MAKNLPASAGYTGSMPGLGRSQCSAATIPLCHKHWSPHLEPLSHNCWAHLPQLLKPEHLEPMLPHKKTHHSEKPPDYKEEQPLLAATRESPRAAMKTQHSPHNKYFFKCSTSKKIFFKKGKRINIQNNALVLAVRIFLHELYGKIQISPLTKEF